MTLPTNVDEGDLGHLGHHESLHVRFNNSVEVRSGIIADRPAAGAVDAGTLYWATDESKLYRSTGAAWEELAAASALDDLTDVTLTAVGDNEVLAFDLGSGEWINMTAAEAGLAIAGHAHSHASTTGQTTDDHHAQSHAHNGADGSGTVAHSATTGKTANDHHNENHAARHAENAADELDVASLGSGAATAGQVPEADGAGGVAWATPSGGGATVVFKTADESVTSSTTLQNDDHLVFAIGANETWIVEYTLLWDAHTAGDIKWDISVPSGGSGEHSSVTGELGNPAQLDIAVALSTAQVGVGVGVPGVTIAKVYAYIENGANAGNVQLRWAQNASNATATTIHKGSSLVARQVV